MVSQEITTLLAGAFQAWQLRFSPREKMRGRWIAVYVEDGFVTGTRFHSKAEARRFARARRGVVRHFRKRMWRYTAPTAWSWGVTDAAVIRWFL